MTQKEELRQIECDDISSAEPGFYPENCCGSCHDDALEGYSDLWVNDWLKVCCAQLHVLENACVDVSNEDEVREFVRKSNGI